MNNNAVKRRYYFTAAEVAKIFGVCTRTVTRLCEQRKITAEKIGKQWRIPETSISVFEKKLRPAMEQEGMRK